MYVQFQIMTIQERNVLLKKELDQSEKVKSELQEKLCVFDERATRWEDKCNEIEAEAQRREMQLEEELAQKVNDLETEGKKVKQLQEDLSTHQNKVSISYLLLTSVVWQYVLHFWPGFSLADVVASWLSKIHRTEGHVL